MRGIDWTEKMAFDPFCQSEPFLIGDLNFIFQKVNKTCDKHWFTNTV